MAISTIKITLPYDIKKVWDTVTSLDNYSWRSDLSKIEILDEKKFIEYTSAGFPTTFTVTACDPTKRWEFDMNNQNMQGHWTGIFTEKGGETLLDLTENVTVQKFLFRLLIKPYLKSQQKRYVNDLQNALKNA